MPPETPHLLAGLHLPYSNTDVSPGAPGDEAPAVLRNRQAAHHGPVAHESPHLLARLHAPHPHGPVPAAGEDVLAVVREGRVAEASGMCEAPQLVSRLGVPDQDNG